MFDPERDGEPDATSLVPDASDDLSLADEPIAPAATSPRRPIRNLPSWASTSTRQRATAVTVAVVATTLVAGLFAWNTGGTPGGTTIAAHSASPASADGTARPGPTGGTGPAPTFEPLTGIAAAPTALLTARGSVGALVPLDAGFRLETVDGSSATALAARLTAQPAFAFALTAEAGDHAVLLSPTVPLAAGTVYRFALHGTAGEVLDSWAFQAKQPLRVVGTLPESKSSDVPLDTGVEVTFDQDGVTGAESHLSIDPATTGRFEQHGRTLAFIPTKPLLASTLYSVTVTRGIAVAATGEATTVDTRFQFETKAAGAAEVAWTYEFPDEATEASTVERPTLELWAYSHGDQGSPTRTGITVYRLPDLDAAIGAYRSLRARPDWTLRSSTGLVDVSGLSRVLTGDLPLNTYRNGFWFQLPARLPAGWYLVQQSGGGKPTQIVLQVSDVSGYLAVSDTKTLVWANDVGTGGPLAGATLSSEGIGFGQTDARGLVVAATPRALLPTPGETCDRPCDPVVVVRTADGRKVFLPVSTGHEKLDGYGGVYWWSDGDARTWSLLHTDRNQFRSGDTVNVWGYARDRDSGRAPSSVTIRLATESDDGSVQGAPAVATATRAPDANGAFHGSLSLAGLPDGRYMLTLSIGSRVIRTTSILVGPIAKPAYQLALTTGRRVYIVGDHMTVTVGARFFEGTPVPGVGLRFDGFAKGSPTTDSLGVAVWRTVAAIGSDEDRLGPIRSSIGAMPARAEEAEISAASREVMIFPSSRTIDTTARIASGKVVAAGTVHLVAVNRVEAAIARGQSVDDVDVRGSAVRNATVTVRFTELVPNRHQVGTEYDFFEKKVVPIYQVDVTDVAAGTVQVRTAADGSWTASVPASAADHTYAIHASVSDPEGHSARATSSASRTAEDPSRGDSFARLEPSTPGNDQREYGIGDRVDITMTDPNLAQAAGDGTRYLFFTAQRGIHGATVQPSSRYKTTFPTWGAPNLSIGGVRFTGSTYVGTTWFGAGFRVADRQLRVDLTTDAARYTPGQTVTVRVRTRTGGGAPVGATVILRAVDEKLFAIAAAAAEDPLTELYSGIGNGVVDTYRSHRTPQGPCECGDTTGGGGDQRDDFRDSLLFQAITTDADGRGSTTFKLSDDLTSWRVTGSAITNRLQAGAGSVLVPVGLPFFVDASIGPEYLLADRPTISIRAFGSAIDAGQPVTIRVRSASLGYDSGALVGRAFANLDVPLPALKAGRQALTITATTGSGATARVDRLTRTFDVVATRLSRQRTAYVELPVSASLHGGPGFTTVLVSDASGGRYLPLLTDLAEGGGARLDRTLAAALATSLLKARFGLEPPDPSAEPFLPDRYQATDDGLAVVPYGSSDLEQTALVAIVAPDRFDHRKLAYYLETIRDNREETRERQLVALAGLAGLGEAVLPAIVASAGDPELSVREQLLLGLGAASLGDSATARRIIERLATSSGEGAGQLARLRVGDSTADITAGTALGAALAAAVDSPLAPRFWAYVEANPAHDRIEVLAAIAFATQMLAHLPVQPARFAWTVDGDRHVVELGASESLRLNLTPAQLASLSIERLAGTVGVTTRWREDVAPSTFTADPDLTISRSFSPATVKASDLVVVDLQVRFARLASNGCRVVVDLVPSGLSPVGAGSRWSDPNNEEPRPDDGVILPYDQTGSRVSFCVAPTNTRREFTLRYVARVVTPGIYAWEPAVAQSATAESIANLTPASSIMIR